MQVKLGTVTQESQLTILQTMPEPFTQKEVYKELLHTFRYYRNGNKITCVMWNSDGTIKGVGVATCHEKDIFDLGTGCQLAEIRARENFYKNCALNYINGYVL